MGNGNRKKWKFFDQMDRLLSHRHNITPLSVFDTMAMCESEPNNLDNSSNFNESDTCTV